MDKRPATLTISASRSLMFCGFYLDSIPLLTLLEAPNVSPPLAALGLHQPAKQIPNIMPHLENLSQYMRQLKRSRNRKSNNISEPRIKDPTKVRLRLFSIFEDVCGSG